MIQIDCMEGGRRGWRVGVGGRFCTHRCMPAPFHHFACKFPQRLDGEGRWWRGGGGAGKGSMCRMQEKDRGRKERREKSGGKEVR